MPAPGSSPPQTDADAHASGGGAGPGAGRSLSDIHHSVRIPSGKRWWLRLFAFAGPAYMISVGYMDPGNWATDIEGGARFGYALIWVLLMSNLMAVLLQTLSARLGIVTGHDLAQACRASYHPLVNIPLYVLCEVAIVAMDLAEVLGTAIGLNLLLHIPLMPAVLVTGLDVLVLLGIQRLGVRKMEAFILTLVATIGACFIIELFLARPSVGGIAGGFVPGPLSGDALYVAIGILGATVMPHNLYLHSSLVQSRDVVRTEGGLSQACRYNLFDSVVALNAAFFVNAAILVLAAATFWRHGIVVTEIQQAHRLLEGVLGSTLAPMAFAFALICAGQSSTLTGTIAGQITMEGFLHLRMRPWLRRLVTRLLAIVPAVIVIWLMGNRGTYELLIFSQVVLSLQLPFAVVPLVRFTSDKGKMGPFANRWWAVALAWIIAGVIIVLNAMLAVQEVAGWVAAAGSWSWLVLAVTVPLGAGLLALLGWLVLKPSRKREPHRAMAADQVARDAVGGGRRYHRIGVALEAGPGDAPMLAEALALARGHGAELVLLHVVEGVGGQWYGKKTRDAEQRSDERYLHELALRLSEDPARGPIPAVRAVLGHGPVVKELVRLAREQELDLLVTGGHGHRGLGDLLRGQTIPGVRHGLRIPLLAVRRRG